MGDKCWAILTIPGVGDVGAWMDEEALSAPGFVDADNLTRIVAGPNNQIGFAKMMDKAMVNMDHVAVLTRPAPDIGAQFAKLWDTPGQIVPANGSDLKFPPRKRF